MKNIHWFICVTTLGLLVQAYGESIFHDTFQAANDTAPNIDYVPRQTDGMTNAIYVLTTDEGRVENTHRILDLDNDGETAYTLKVYKPLGGIGSTSYTAGKTSVEFSSFLTNAYEITVDSQFWNGGGTPSEFDTKFIVGVVWSSPPTPTNFASMFSVGLDGAGGGFDIYGNAGTLLHHADTGSTITWMERFELKLVVDESASSVQVLVQGINDAEATDLGTYTVDFSGHPERYLQMYASQTDNGSGGGGFLEVQTFELDVSLKTFFESAYDVWSNSYTLVEGPSGDDDSDGLLNIYEYGLGGDPTNAADQGTSPEFGIVDVGGTNWFGYVHPQLSDPDSGLSYFLETCTDLVSGTWTNAGYMVTGTNVTGNSLDFVTNVTDTAEDQKFIRLIIE